MEIVFVRHGKPVSASKATVDAHQFSLWIGEYDDSKIDATSHPSDDLLALCAESYVISSTLPRAIHSTEIASKKSPSKTYYLLNEMKLPAHFLPFKMSISTWLIINRILWLLGFSGNVESYKKAKVRASSMAKELSLLSKRNKHIVVFGHSLMNRQISIELVKLGWKKENTANGYWSIEKLSLLLSP